MVLSRLGHSTVMFGQRQRRRSRTTNVLIVLLSESEKLHRVIAVSRYSIRRRQSGPQSGALLLPKTDSRRSREWFASPVPHTVISLQPSRYFHVFTVVTFPFYDRSSTLSLCKLIFSQFNCCESENVLMLLTYILRYFSVEILFSRETCSNDDKE